MLKSSQAHLAEVGETYFEHMRFAMLVGALAIGAGLACLLHALVPAVCERSCSRAVSSLQMLFADRGKLGTVVADNSALLIFMVLTATSLIAAVAIALTTSRSALALILIPQAFVLPLIFLAQNRGLEPLAD